MTWLTLLGLACLSTSFVASSVAAAADEDPEAAIYAFRLAGSNGYEVSVSAASGYGSEPAYVAITARRRGASATYIARGSVTASSVRASFGSLGVLDLDVRPSGISEEIAFECGSGSERFEPGVVQGTISFRGEGGFTSVAASSVRLVPWFQGFEACGGGWGESSGPGIPGARLKGISYAGGRTLSFQINKNRPGAPTIYKASLRERHGGLRIFRDVKGVAGSAAFRFGHSLRSATLSPPAPFSGSATARRSADTVSPLWNGNLALDFPGRPALALAGREIHVSLTHTRLTRGGDASIRFRPHGL